MTVMTAETVMDTETASVSVALSDVSNDSTPTSAKKARDSTKWLHKTKLCVYSVQGQCRLGSKCSFAHSATEVQEAPNLYKTQLCEAFMQGKKCEAESCSFAHGEEELRLSPNFKNKMCKWFSKGKCRNGAECGFAHGAEELRNPTLAVDPLVLEGDITPPPGLSREVEAKSEKLVLDLQGSLIDEKAPPSLGEQVEGMSATIAALQWKMNEIELRSQVSGMKQYLGQLSSQVAELENALGRSSEQTASAPKAPTQRTSLRSTLSSKATPFQPLSSKAMPFVPGFETFPSFQSAYDTDTTCWPSDDSVSNGSGVDSGGFSSD